MAMTAEWDQEMIRRMRQYEQDLLAAILGTTTEVERYLREIIATIENEINMISSK